MNTTNDSHTDCRLRVRYAETDRMGVVHHSNHFVWFEAARSEYCRARGFSYRQMEEEGHCLLMVAEARCRYKAPLYYEDIIVVRTRIKNLRRKFIAFSYEIFRESTMQLIATGETSHMVTDKDGNPSMISEEYLSRLRSGTEIPKDHPVFL